MCLLDDVRLIGSENLALPTANTFERLSTKPASYELGNSWEQFCYSSWKYDWKPSLAENWKNSRPFRFEIESMIKSPTQSV